MQYELRFNPAMIQELADRYVRDNNDQEIEKISPKVQKVGWYSQDEFLKVCRWKSPRTQKHCVKNDPTYIREVTSIALKTSNEQLRIEILTILSGVDWPTASVLLHFGYFELYPILDFRALWSLTIPKPHTYNYLFWSDYVQICRKIAETNKVSMRTLDRALWQYSSENQSKTELVQKIDS